MTTLKRLTQRLSIALMATASSAFAGPIEYTQLTSVQNQPATNPLNLASLETVDGIQNIGNALNKVTVKNGGYYFVMATGQAGALKQNAPSGVVDMWLVKNGVSLPNTGSRASVTGTTTTMITCQNLIQLSAGDSISVGFSASDPSLGLISIKPNNSEPVITSLTFTIYRLN